jgi:hypothetical protein
MKTNQIETNGRDLWGVVAELRGRAALNQDMSESELESVLCARIEFFSIKSSQIK